LIKIRLKRRQSPIVETKWLAIVRAPR